MSNECTDNICRIEYLTNLLKQRPTYMTWSRILMIAVVHNTCNFEGAYWQQTHRFHMFVLHITYNGHRCRKWDKISQIPKYITSLPVCIASFPTVCFTYNGHRCSDWNTISQIPKYISSLLVYIASVPTWTRVLHIL